MRSAGAEAKSQLRSSVRRLVGTLSPSVIVASSNAITERVIHHLPQWCPASSPAPAISVYLSMPAEVQTGDLVKQLLQDGRKVYVPLVVGDGADDMRMVPVTDWDEICNFALSKWKIPEPSLEQAFSREDGAESADIGLVIAPGCAFDTLGGRLGYGRGYYDSFIRRLTNRCNQKGLPCPVVSGLALREQVVPSVPTDELDIAVDYIVTPDKVHSVCKTR